MIPPSETVRIQHREAALFTFIAGYIDAYTLLNYRLYASFMSGNTTRVGLRAGAGEFLDAVYNLLPIPLYVLGVFVGTWILQSGNRRPLYPICVLVGVLLAVSLAAVALISDSAWGVIMLLSLAMGVMNTTIAQVSGQNVSLCFITGDLTNMSRHLLGALKRTPLSDSKGPWDGHLFRAGVLASIWACFLTGALVAGLGMPYLGIWILVPPALALLGEAAWQRVRQVKAIGKADTAAAPKSVVASVAHG